jgi:hypothetical protein
MFLFAYGPALAETRSTSSSTPVVGSVRKGDIVCPSMEFTVFFRAFQENRALQRKFTRIPLSFGKYIDDANHIANIVFKKVSSYEKIPMYIKATDNIMPDRAEMEPKKLEFRITTSESPVVDDGIPEVALDSPDKVNATLFLDDTCLSISYHFRRNGTCWFLVAILDSSL